MDVGPAMAAARLAKMDVALIVAGLSPGVRVFDPAVFSPEAEPSGADVVSSAGRARGLHADIGGYVVVARHPEAWDAVVEVLLALEEHHADMFHRVMRGCRSLSDSGRETDGLDHLLSEAAQARCDLSLSREQRRDRLGFLSPQQARAFLDSARHLPHMVEPTQDDVLFAAYRRSLPVIPEAEMRSPPESAEAPADEPPAADPSAVASVIDVLRGAGVLAEPPRALLPSAQEEPLSGNAALKRYLKALRGIRRCRIDGARSGTRVPRKRARGRVFGAGKAVCSARGRGRRRGNVQPGIDYWPQQWRAPSTHASRRRVPDGVDRPPPRGVDVRG